MTLCFKRHAEGWQFSRKGRVLGISWHAEEFFGAVLRRRKWVRTRRKSKQEKQRGQAQPLASPFLNSRKFLFVCKVVGEDGQPLTVWRPETPPNYLSLGDCISPGLDPPTNPAVVVDTSRLTSIRPIYQRHWIQRATKFDLVWTNEQVYFWRPLVPYVPDRFLRGKQLHPLGCVCTLSDSPPDVESVAVIHEEYLEPANDISDFDAGHWTSAWVLNQKSAISKLPDDEVEDVCFFINMKTNLVYMKLSVEWLDEAETMELWSIPQPSAWRLKQRVMPAKEMNDVARSSRYAPHLKVLMNSDTRSRAHGELTTCSALVTDGDSSGLELMTASGATLRSWNVSTGECEHELHFHSEAISCMASSGLTVFSAGGSMLIGSFEGRQLPGARLQHSSAITCVHCCAVSSVDVAIVSGTDQSDGQVRCWMGTQAPGSSTLGDFRRVAMPAIGQHEHTVRACTVWPRVSVPMIPVGFRYFRMQVALMPKAVTLKNLCIVDVNGEVIQPSRVIDLTSGKPTDLARTGASVDWEIRDRVIGSLCSSFVRCATAVVEFQFALPVRNAAVHWSMDPPKKDKGNGIETSSDKQGTSGPAVSKTPRGAPKVQWKIFASDDWVHWLELKGSEVAFESIVTSGDDLTVDQVTLPRKQHTVVRTKAFALKTPNDAAVVVAPFAPTALQHLPMIVSASDDVIRIWTVSNSTVSGAKGACVGEMACDIGKISSCTVLRDGSVVTGSDTGIVQIWTPSTNACSTLRVFSGVTALNTVYSDTSCNNLVQERRALLPGCDPHSCLRYTFRHGGPTSDKFMVPRLNGPAMAEAESVEFDGLVWMVTSCRNLLSSRNGGKGVCLEGSINGTVYSLSVRDAKVILVPGRSQCAWGISFQERSAGPRAHMTTMGGPAPGSISIWSAYVVQSSELKLYTKPDIDSELAIVLSKGTQIQAVGKQTRSGGRMWQEFVTGGESDADGWLPVSDPKAKPSSLIEGVLAPIKTLTPTVRIRYLGSSGQAAQYLGVGGKLDDGIKLVSGDVAMECGLFQLEEAAPPASLLCGCADGSVQIWDRPNSYSRWRERATTAMPRHAGAVKELHVLQRPIRNGSAAGFDSYSSGETLLISCSHETGEDNDQTIGVWRLQQQETPACVCRLHPLIVDDCIAGMVKYVDHGNDGDFEMTLADESSALLTAHDMLLVKAQYEGLFASLIKTLTLEPVIDNRIAVRSTNRRLSGDDSFLREERGNSQAYMYWIQASNCETGIPVTFVPEERLQMADIVAMQLGASKHTIVRDATLPPDMIGGMFEVENRNESTGFLNVRELSSDVTFANRLPSDFVATGFWEGYQPPCLSAWSLLYFLLPLQYDTMQEFLTMRALRSSQQETMPPNITAATTVAEAEWSQLLTRAVSGVPMEACIIPLPNAAGPYTGSRMQWRRLIGLGVEDRDPADLSLLHACVDYCDSHPEENYEIFALDVCDVIVQFKWSQYGRRHLYSQLRAYLWLVALFSWFTVRTVEISSKTGESWHDHVIVYFATAITVYFMFMEFWNLLATGYYNYCLDFWNCIDWTCYTLVLYCLFVGYKVPGSDNDAVWAIPSPPALALAQLLLWAKVLYFMRAFEGTGVYILTIVHILKDIQSFLLIGLIVLVGFGFAFYVLFQTSDSYLNDSHVMAYSNLGWSLVSTFNMGVMGDFDTDMFHLQENETMLLALFLLLVSMVSIVMLNLLIALMGSTYERATEQSSAASRYERACILLELEATMVGADRVNPSYFPKFLHVLREKQRVDPATPAGGASADYDGGVPPPHTSNHTVGDGALKLEKQLSELASRQQEQSTLLRQLLDAANAVPAQSSLLENSL